MKTVTRKTERDKTCKAIKKVLREFILNLLRRPRQADETGYEIVGRLDYDQVATFIEDALGRRLTGVETAALEENYRPQGLLTPDDCYTFRLSSPRYLGSCAPEIEISGTAVSGYANGCATLKVAETVSVHLDDGSSEIDDELVARF